MTGFTRRGDIERLERGKGLKWGEGVQGVMPRGCRRIRRCTEMIDRDMKRIL